MLQLALAAGSALAVSAVLVLICRAIALRYGYIARPRADRWHGRPTALLGGVGIAVTVLGLHAVLLGVRSLPALLVASAAIFAIGLADDLLSLKPATKLVFQIAVASFLVFFGYRLDWVSSLTLDTLLTVFWIVGLTNAFNLLDNMDGLCAGISLIAGAGMLAAFRVSGAQGPETVHLALLVGASAGFLIFNFQPASIFMGDSGSLFLGLSLSVLALVPSPQLHTPSKVMSVLAAPAMILILPILDTTLVTVSRLLSGRSAARGGRDHSSHRLVAIGLSERSAVLALWALAGLGGLLGIALQNYQGDVPGIAAAVFLIAMVIFAVYLARVRVYEEEDAGAKLRERMTPLVVNFVYRRRVAEVLLDLCLIAISYYSAYRLRFAGPMFATFFPQFLQSLPLVVGVQLLSLFVAGGYRGVWQYFGLMDSVTVGKGVALGTLLNVSLLVYVYRFESYSRGVFVIYAALLLLFIAGSRASFRLISEFAQRRNRNGVRVVIYGAGDIAASAVRDILGQRYGAYNLLGFIVEDPTLERARMQGYPVLGGRETLHAMIDAGRVELVVITQLMDVDRLDDLQSRCAERRVSLERLHLALDQLVAAS